MIIDPPRMRHYVSPSPEQIKQQEAETQKWREEIELRRENSRPAHLAALEAGPELRDMTAALDCHCSCHPRPADIDQHNGGVNCGCQLTPEERRRQWSELPALFRSSPEEKAKADQRRAEFAATAARLGVTAKVAVGAAPFVITGNVDGRGFYLRERHGSYCVTIAADDNPGADPWTQPIEEPELDIASGCDDDFLTPEGSYSDIRALEIAVQTVREYLLRQNCDHKPTSNPTGQYCPRCGSRALTCLRL